MATCTKKRRPLSSRYIGCSTAVRSTPSRKRRSCWSRYSISSDPGPRPDPKLVRLLGDRRTRVDRIEEREAGRDEDQRGGGLHPERLVPATQDRRHPREREARVRQRLEVVVAVIEHAG